MQVARQLTHHDALGAHARDELGLAEVTAARPLMAALSSGAAFTVGAALPLVTLLVAPPAWMGVTTTVVSLITLALLGGLSARAGGAPVGRAVARVCFWGAAAMAATAAVGWLFGTTVG